MSIVISQPPDSLRKTQPDWRSIAVATITEFVEKRPNAPFTTKDVWPLLDNPKGDKRVMGVVMSDLVKSGVIKRIDVTPDPGPATTRDGVAIPYNRAITVFKGTK